MERTHAATRSPVASLISRAVVLREGRISYDGAPNRAVHTPDADPHPLDPDTAAGAALAVTIAGAIAIELLRVKGRTIAAVGDDTCIECW